jgi:predicted dehydrogenase
MHLPIRALVVGAGQRALIYASYALYHPDELQIVGVAEPDERRRAYVRDLYGLAPERCFDSAEEAASRPKFADVAINGTMDHQHVPTSIPLLRAGYDLLLEKPFAVSESEMWALTRTAQALDRRVMVCHVLRYSAFYSAIRQRILDDKIGDILSMHSAEHVSYRHMAVSYVRGKWARKQQGYASMLMAKCSHDLDLIAWMKSGISPTSVVSFGSNFQFRPERAPEGSGTRCLVDCAIERDCIYSARENYIDHVDHHNVYVWGNVDGSREPTLEQKIAALEGDSPYGRCVWRCDMDVVDHQTVVVDFEDGSTATHHMVGGTAKPSRFIHIIGTKGEIEGTFEDNRFVVRQIDPRPGHEFLEEDVNVSEGSAGAAVAKNHGGGDFRLVRDFVRVMHGEAPSIATTTLADSVAGHLIGFSADRAMEEQRVVKLTSDK